MASNVLRRDVPSQYPGGCPAVVALPRVPVEYDAAPGPALEFPGCVPIRLTADELEVRDERLEFWDARTETAWEVREPSSPVHELSGSTLSALLARIAAVRGSPIVCYGSMDLLQRDEGGGPRRVMQADQSVYVRPGRAALPGLDAMVVGDHDCPDVVLEVDHTTDVRRGKLLQYEAWGFPELWVEVPDRAARSRPRPLAPGLTIYLLGENGYEIVGESRAFPGWTADEIHGALNEPTLSAHTSEALERVGMLMGEAAGTGPDDDPLLRSQRRKSYDIGRAQGRTEGHAQGRAEGHAEGRAEGHAEGRAEGGAEGRAALLLGILRSRGIGVSAGFVETLREAPAFVGPSDEVLAAAAMAAESEADFLRRIRQMGDPKSKSAPR